MSFQNTLKIPIKFSGIGVHNGKVANVTIKPAPDNAGIIFKRIDLSPANNLVKAHYNNVVETNLCTVISNSYGIKVSTIEHLMSALWGMEIDNALIEIDQPEMPIMDGSSAPFVSMLKKAGIIAQNSVRKYIKILNEVSVCHEDKWIKLKPSETTSYHCTVDFNHPFIGHQEAKFIEHTSQYGHAVSRARTFGFTKDIEALKSIGLAKGASLDNAIGIDDCGIMNPEGLRYDNEFANHKLLDLIGDIYLAGYRISGEIVGYKCGHYLNNEILKQLFSDVNNYIYTNSMTPTKILMDVVSYY